MGKLSIGKYLSRCLGSDKYGTFGYESTNLVGLHLSWEQYCVELFEFVLVLENGSGGDEAVCSCGIEAEKGEEH